MDLIIKNTEMLTIDIIEDQEKDKEKLIGYLNRYSKEQNTVLISGIIQPGLLSSSSINPMPTSFLGILKGLESMDLRQPVSYARGIPKFY